MPKTPLIQFKNIVKEYDSKESSEEQVKVLNDVSFSVDKGEFVFLVGPSGAGKSTLVKILIREEVPNAGEVIFDGEDVLSIPQDQISDLRRRIGVVFQDFKLLNSKNVFENVAVALEVTDCPKEVLNDVVPNVLSMVGMTKDMYKFPEQLSGGEKQRAVIARALAHEPDVLIADEPTGNIDPEATTQIMEILKKINDLGTTVIMATHDQHIVNRSKRRVVRLEDGVVISDKKEGKYE